MSTKLSQNVCNHKILDEFDYAVMHPGFPNYGAYAPLIWQKGGI